ncbi:MAG: nuclear transport factor 2 family protein [Bacteroidales bacterium]|nr:nuclear transport factor 2 family protein [Bacteroidales bacterium]
MKKYLLLFTAFILIASTSCQKKVDIEKEKEAIMAVIQAESETARDGDVDGLISCYIQDEYNTRLILQSDTGYIITGWEKLAQLFVMFKSNAELDYSNISVSKENAVIKVMGNTAWVICDNIWKGIYNQNEINSETYQITFLEKVDGEWKFSFVAWIAKPEPAAVTEEPEATQ